MSRFGTFCGLILAAAAVVGCDNSSSTSSTGGGSTTNPSGGGGKSLRIAVIPKGTSHEFWRTVEGGVRRAGSELGVEVIWKGPVQENDRAMQVQIVEQFTTEGVDAIALAPLDKAALVRPVQEASAKKIPVVIFDSGLDGTPGTDFVSFVATDNKEGGRMGGRKMVEILGGKGKVVLMRYAEGHASTGEREAGFLEIVKAAPGITVTVENRYAGATAAEAQTTAMNLADDLRAADGVFCPNESSAFGMLQALNQLGLAGKIKFVGFDTSEPLLGALREGQVQALVAQNPQKMGYEAVRVAVEKARGKTVEERVDSGAALITKDNLESPEIKALLGSK